MRSILGGKWNHIRRRLGERFLSSQYPPIGGLKMISVVFLLASIKFAGLQQNNRFDWDKVWGQSHFVRT